MGSVGQTADRAHPDTSHRTVEPLSGATVDLGHTRGVSSPETPLSAPGAPNPASPVVPANSPGMSFSQSSPLGGTLPRTVAAPVKSDRRELILTAVLLISALLVGASSLMPWRDYAFRYGTRAQETGWAGANGNLGRGWITVFLAVLLAISGVLIAAESGRAGRVLAALSGTALVLFAIAEWGLGAGNSRTGPGAGIWVELVVGLVVVIAVGVLGPVDTATAASEA